jgi:glycosyltransferase involved in cell wall biosynthesis
MKNAHIPLISVIIAVFNGAKTLQQCIDSFSQQTYPRKELIIIDGGSTDGSVEILNANNKQISYWISEPDKGIYNAWNKGLLQAKGDWICFLGADDYFWNSQVLEQMSLALENIPTEVRIIYAQIMLLNTEGEVLFSIGEPWDKIKRNFRQGLCPLPHPGAMHRRSLFEENGKFDESFHIAGDYELLLRELKMGDAVFIPSLIIVGMRQGGLSSNPLSSIEVMLEGRRAMKMHGQYFPSFLWLKTILKIYLRMLLWYCVGETSTKKLLDFARRIKGLPPYWTRM